MRYKIKIVFYFKNSKHSRKFRAHHAQDSLRFLWHKMLCTVLSGSDNKKYQHGTNLYRYGRKIRLNILKWLFPEENRLS